MASGILIVLMWLMCVATAIWAMVAEPWTALVIMPPVLWWIVREIKRRRAYAKIEREHFQRRLDRFYFAELAAEAKRKAWAEEDRKRQSPRVDF